MACAWRPCIVEFVKEVEKKFSAAASPTVENTTCFQSFSISILIKCEYAHCVESTDRRTRALPVRYIVPIVLFECAKRRVIVVNELVERRRPAAGVGLSDHICASRCQLGQESGFSTCVESCP